MSPDLAGRGRRGVPAARHGSTDGWQIERISGPASELHAREVPVPARRSIWILEVPRPTVVLGSTQPLEHVDLDTVAAAGLDLARRRSGGGAVLLVPGDALWVDAIVPHGDLLWEPDVGRAFGWFGRAWAAALSDLGVAGSVHDGRLVRSRWSALVCFAGLGPGEVTVGERKVVGMSQRRTRTAARFQAVAHGRWEPAAVLAALALSPSDRRAARDELAAAALGVEADLGLRLDSLATALLARLP